ncbi:MAG: hypothetical protein RR835_02695 [Peptostreptococcaceae bacterium]
MNLGRLSIIGIILVIILELPNAIDYIKRADSEVVNVKYSEIVTNACKDATEELVVINNDKSIEMAGDGENINYEKIDFNKNKALERFYKSLYINLNIENDYAAQQVLFEHIPIKIVVGYDGYYINSWVKEYNNQKAKYETKQKWVGKMKYSKVDNKNNIKIDFTLNENVTITNKVTNQVTTGNRKDFDKKYPNSYFGREFENIRNQTIFEAVQNSVEYYTHASNNIAKKNGWKYSFKAPYVDSKLLKNISFLALMQGNGEQGVNNKFNTYGFSVSKIERKNKVYGYTKDGIKYYKENYDKNCEEIFDSEIEAAASGYRPVDPR